AQRGDQVGREGRIVSLMSGMDAGRIVPLRYRRQAGVCRSPPRQLTEFPGRGEKPLPDRFAVSRLFEDGGGAAEFLRHQRIQVVSADEIVHVPKLFNPSLDSTSEPFANLATRTGLNNLRWVAHEPLVGQA